jgi:hypothetical protein
MSFASFTLAIVLFINLFFFLAGTPEVNSPMLGLIKGISTGSYNVDWSQFFSFSKLLQIGSIITLVLIVSTALSPASTLTGSFATFHALTIIATAIFISFCAIPNFGAMLIPSPLDSVINIMFGFMVTLSIFGMMKGE